MKQSLIWPISQKLFWNFVLTIVFKKPGFRYWCQGRLRVTMSRLMMSDQDFRIGEFLHTNRTLKIPTATIFHSFYQLGFGLFQCDYGAQQTNKNGNYQRTFEKIYKNCQTFSESHPNNISASLAADLAHFLKLIFKSKKSTKVASISRNCTFLEDFPWTCWTWLRPTHV